MAQDDKVKQDNRIANFAAGMVERTDCLIGLTSAMVALVEKYQAIEIDRNKRNESTE